MRKRDIERLRRMQAMVDQYLADGAGGTTQFDLLNDIGTGNKQMVCLPSLDEIERGRAARYAAREI